MITLRASPGDAIVLLILAIFFSVAVWVRLQYIAILGGGESYVEWARENYFGGVSAMYLALARSLAEGTGYFVNITAAKDWLPYDVRLSRATDYYPLIYPPGYPIFVAVLYKLGLTKLEFIRVVHAVVDSATIFGIYYLLRKAGALRAVSLLAIVLFAVYPLWAAGSTFLLAESLNVFFIVLILSLLVIAQRTQRSWQWLLCGLVCGAVALTRPDFLLIVLVAGVWLFATSPRSVLLRLGAAFLLGFIGPISVWGVHNKMVHDSWVFASTSGGSGLYQGLGEMPNPYGYVLSDSKTQELLRTNGLKWATPEADRFLKQKYLQAWSEHPIYVLQTIFNRWKHILFTSESLRPDPVPWIRSVFDAWGAWVVLAAAVVFRRQPVALLIIVTPVIYALLSIGLVHWEPRYVRYVHLSYLFAFLLLISCVLSGLGDRWRTGGNAVSAIVFLGTVAAVTAALPSLAYERRMAVTIPSVERLFANDSAEFRKILGLGRLPWTAVGTAVISADQTGLLLRTSEGPFHYQAMAPLATEGIEFFLLSYSLEILEGGITVGVLSKDGEWVRAKNHTTLGKVESSFAVPVGRNERVTLVLANYNPHGSSVAQLVRFDVYGLPRYRVQ